MSVVALPMRAPEGKDAEYERFSRQIKRLTEMAWKVYQENGYGYVQMSFEAGKVSGFVYHVTEKPVK